MIEGTWHQTRSWTLQWGIGCHAVVAALPTGHYQFSLMSDIGLSAVSTCDTEEEAKEAVETFIKTYIATETVVHDARYSR